MTKRERDEYSDRADLNSAGWRVEKTDSIRFNGGSETLKHATLKMITGYALRENGYRVSSEVESKDGRSEIDILAYAGGGPPFAVELETNPDRETVTSKINRYVRSNDIIRECFVLPIEDAPTGFEAAREWVCGELF